MRIGELASSLGISKDAVQAWVHHPELEHFFSDGAKLGAGASQRVFNENDVLILNTVRHMRNTEKVKDWSLIAQRIEKKDYEQDFPQNAIATDTRVIPIQQAEQSAKAMHTLAERDAAIAQVNELHSRIAALEKQLETERTQHKQDLERLLREIAALNREIGRLERDKNE